MKSIRQRFSLFLSLFVLAMAAVPATGGELIPNRYLVVFKDGVTSAIPGLSVAEQAGQLVFTHGGRRGRVFEHAIRGFEFEGSEAAARALARDPRIALVEQQQYLELAATQSLPHWGLDRIDERDRPRNNHFTYNTTGAGVNLYILDTGINADAEFGTRKVDAFTAITDANGVPQYADCNGHGTSVAKLAGGATSGVAKGAKLHNVRIGSICTGCPTGGGVPENRVQSTGGCGLISGDVMAGMEWVAANRVRPAVANLSFTGAASATLDTAARNMHNAGITVVSAAGNGAVDACGNSPARLPESVTVGASDSNDARAIFSTVPFRASNTGTCVDLFAPGKDLNGFGGTSAAAPIVTGAAALYLQTNTTASPATVTSFLLNNATPGRLTDIGSSPNRLLFVPPGGSETDNRPVATGFTCNCNGGRTCSLTATGFTDDFAVTSCRFLVDYDKWNRPVFKYGCGTVSHTYAYTGPYLIEFQVIDDAGQTSDFIARNCQ